MMWLIAGGVSAITFVMVLIAGFIVIAKYRIVPETDEAIVITGATNKEKVLNADGSPTGEVVQKPTVVVGGGAYVIPIFRKYKIVSLEVVQIPIAWEGTGGATLPSKDRIPVILEGELSVVIDGKNEDQIILASQKLGIPQIGRRVKKGDTPFTMAAAVKSKADKIVAAALRTAVFEFDFVDLNAKKEEFEKRVHELVQQDLAKYGLTLVSVSIPLVSQGSFGEEGSGDMFDEQGREKVASIVEAARTKKNDIEQQNRIERARRDREAKEQELQIEKEVAEKVADQAREVAVYQANQARQQTEATLAETQAEEVARARQTREIAEAAAKESEATDKANIAMAEAVSVRQAEAKAAKLEATEKAAIREAEAAAERQVAQEEAERLKQEAEIRKLKAVEEANIAKDQAVKVADEQRQQAIEEAEVERQKAVAEKRAEEAAARATQATAEAKQKEAEESVQTVQAEAQADRQRRIVTIKAEEEAAKDKIEADKVAYVAAKRAEGERDAELNRAEAQVAKARGEADAKTTNAQGTANSVKIQAEGYAQNTRIRAEADAEAADQQASAKIKLAEATLKEGEAIAESERLMVEARNQVATELLIRDVSLAFIKQAPAMLHEVMAPVANVAHDVKILQVSGLGGEGETEGLPATILNTGLAAAGIAPFLKDAINAAKANPDVQDIAGSVAEIATDAIAKTAKAIKSNGNNGLPVPPVAGK